MAINAYTGLMGSGKSFEVVGSVIVPALKNGRRVVTNIDGISYERIREYLINTQKCSSDQLGELIAVTNDDVQKSGFFPDEKAPDRKAIVKGGDLVCIDEVWQFWSTEHKIPPEHMAFFRMHRHYTHEETGVTCDVALMIQDLGTLHRSLRAVIEMTSRTVKLKSIGAPTAYRIELFEGNKLTKKAQIDTFVKKYDAAIFPLYKSYASGSGTEKAIDKRQNVLTNPRIWIMLALVILFIAIGCYFAYRFFNPKISVHGPSRGEATPAGTAPGVAAQVSIAHVLAEHPKDEYSTNWRVVGRYSSGDASWVVITNSGGRLRVESPSVFQGQGLEAIGMVDGSKVTHWTGESQPSVFNPANDKK